MPEAAGTLRIELVAADGTVTVLKASVHGARRRGHRRHVHEQAGARRVPRPSRSPTPRPKGVLFSLHLKATMMKVSDPIMFGHAVQGVLRRRVRQARRRARRRRRQPQQRLRRRARARSPALPGRPARRDRGRHRRPSSPTAPRIAMVDSDRGITNLHVPSDIIVDASMPAMIRTVGPDVERRRQDAGHARPSSPTPATPASTRPSSTTAKANGAFDPRTMGSVPNVGLMAQAAEEYGSHDKTFEIPADGTVRVVDAGRRGAHGVDVEAGRHLAHVPGQGPADPGLGEARRHPRPGHRRAGRVLARRAARPRRAAHRQGAAATCRTTTPPGSTSRS